MTTKMPNKVALPTSVRNHANISLNGVNLTTMDFGTTNVGYFQEILPNDSIEGKINTFVQLSQLIVPTMGSATLYSRAFFVPYRFVWNAWESFASNKPYHKGNILIGTPYVNPRVLSSFMFPYSGDTVPSPGYSTPMYEVVDGNTAYDFLVGFIPNPQDATKTVNARVRLTPFARDVYSMLRSIGYVVQPFAAPVVSYINNNGVSALPLLALAKIFRDYYVNPNYQYEDIDELLTKGSSYSIKVSDLQLIFTFVHYAWYQSDIFTSAWASPEQVAYTPDFYKTIEIVNQISNTPDVKSYIDSPDSSIGNLVTRLKSYAGSAVSADIAQQALNTLKAVRNIVIRQNAAGGRYIDQMLAKYGIRLDPNESRFSQFVGYGESKLNISRVDATAAGSDGVNVSALGDFTGRGTMSGDGSFRFTADKNDFGCLIVLNHIIPDTHYYQGQNPQLLHREMVDFWNGDLETVANAPIPYSALYGQYVNCTDYLADKNDDSLESVFGFHANYWENKIGRDILSGDFLLGSRNTELDSFHMFRKLAPASSRADAGNAAVLSPQFQQMTDDNIRSYVKIFNETSNFNCHFIVHQYFDVNANRTVYPLQETLVHELKEHGDSVGSLVNIRPNGQYF